MLASVGPFTLRPHQVRAVQQLRESIRRGNRRIILQAPCGFGKTLVSTAIFNALKPGHRGIFITSGRQLIFQKSWKMAECELPHSVLMANCQDSIDGRWGREYSRFNPEEWHKCLVISKDTYQSRLDKGWLEEFECDVAIVDEAHLGMSDRWWDILERLAKVTIGLTATPADGKGRGLGGPERYQDIVVGATYQELIDGGWLTPCKVFVPYTLSMKGVSVGANGEYVQTQSAERWNQDELIGDGVKTWLEHGNNEPTLVFAASVEHAIGLKERFNAMGVPAEHVEADTPQHERQDIYERFRNGDIRVITNYGVLRVGVDFPCASCVQLLVSMNSLTTFMQTVGRGLRSYPGKEFCRIIDHGGNVIKHGWPTEDRLWTLDPGDVVKRVDRNTGEATDKPPTVSVCPKCKFEKGGMKKCPNCGYEYKRSGVMERTVDGKFSEITPNQVKKKRDVSDRQKLWMQCLGIAAAKNMSVAAARGMFRNRTGTYPDDCGPSAEPHQFRMKVASVWPGFRRSKS